MCIYTSGVEFWRFISGECGADSTAAAKFCTKKNGVYTAKSTALQSGATYSLQHHHCVACMELCIRQ